MHTYMHTIPPTVSVGVGAKVSGKEVEVISVVELKVTGWVGNTVAIQAK